MRPWAQILPTILVALLFAPVTAQTPAAPSKPSASQTAKPRYYVPGVGGAVPTRANTPPATAPNTKGIYGPTQLPLAGKSPAQILVPGLGGVLPGLGQLGSEPFPALQAIKVSPLIYGVNVAWGDNGENENWDKDGGAKFRRLAQLLKGAGATTSRIRIRWSEIERKRGTYEWSATDRFVRQVASLGVTPVCLISGSPAWAVDRSVEATNLLQQAGLSYSDDKYPPDPAYYPDFSRFVFALSQRYRDKIKLWEFWGDVDADGMPVLAKDANGRPMEVRFGDVKTYSQLLKLFAAGIRKADLSAKIAAGGLRIQNVEFINALYLSGSKPYFDAISLHPVPDKSGIPFEWIDRCREVMVKNGDAAKSFWITEWGWPAELPPGEAIGELHKARIVRDAFVGFRVRPFISVAEFQTLNDWRSEERDANSLILSGLATYNMAAGPAYSAFREAAGGQPAVQPHIYKSVRLVAPLPSSGEDGIRPSFVNVSLDASKPGLPVNRVWDGFVQERDGGDYERFVESADRLKALKPGLVRFDPFPNPDAVRLQEIVVEAAAGSGVPGRASPLSIDWTYSDRMTEAIIRTGARPMLDFATMPSVLSAPAGNTRLPRETAQWEAFVRSVVQRYRGELKKGSFYWELSHEPDTGDFTIAEWLRFYDRFALAVTSADPNARVGGPAAATFNFEWLKALIAHCASEHVPLHFLTWHAYDLKPAEYGKQVARIREYLGRFPALKDVEVIIGEWNLRASPSPENDGLPAAIHALSVAEHLSETPNVRSMFFAVRDGQDIRSSGAKLTGRWGLLSNDNLPKPVYHSFSMLSHLMGRQIKTLSEETDVHAMAALGADRLAVVIWNASEPREKNSKSEDLPVRLRISGLPWRESIRGKQWLVDTLRGNLATKSSAAELPQVASFDVGSGDPEIVVILPPQVFTLLELRPYPKPTLEATLDSSRYVNYGGGPFILTGSVRNSGATLRTVSVKLESSDNSMVPLTALRPIRLSLKAGELRTFRYGLVPPATVDEAAQFFQLTSGDAAASTSVKFASPLKARLVPARVDLQRPDAAADSEQATARFAAVLENRASAPLRFGIIGGKEGQSVTVPARNSVSVPLALAAPSRRPGNYQMPVKILVDQKVAATLDAVIGVPALSKFVARRPRIDGDLVDWTESTSIQLGNTDLRRANNAVSAQVSTQWDDENFYLAAVVNDEKSHEPVSADAIEQGDSVQFALDIKRETSGHRIGAIANVHEFAMAAIRGRPVILRLAANGRARGPVSGATLAIRRVGNRTIYETAIPWAELSPVRPQDGGVIGLSLQVNDSDGVQRRVLEWPGGLSGGIDPSRFLALRLLRR